MAAVLQNQFFLKRELGRTDFKEVFCADRMFLFFKTDAGDFQIIEKIMRKTNLLQLIKLAWEDDWYNQDELNNDALKRNRLSYIYALARNSRYVESRRSKWIESALRRIGDLREQENYCLRIIYVKSELKLEWPARGANPRHSIREAQCYPPGHLPLIFQSNTSIS